MTLALRRLLFCAFLVLGLSAPLGCGEADLGEGGYEAKGFRPVDLVERFPERAQIEHATKSYLHNPQQARAFDPVSVPEFFGKDLQSANMHNLRVERLKAGPYGGEKPVAFLWSRFHDTDMYWNNRYKDVQLFRLVDATGATHNPFPHAEHVRHEGSALVRLWIDYQPVSQGAPKELFGAELYAETARIAVWSYVSGNVDGPASNGNNGGFGRFRDSNGREFWKGVLIDGGAAWNQPSDAHKPWNTNLLNTGPVVRENIPNGVINSLSQIARASAEELATMSKFDQVDEGAKNIVRGIRERAREVLDHYEIPWE